MAKKAVFGMALSDEQAQRIIDKLLTSSFSNEDISILYPSIDNDRVITNERGEIVYEEFSVEQKKRGHISTEKHTKAPEGGVLGATAGGILGGSIGLLAGVGLLAIPGLGPFVAAGPVMGALSGSALGGSLGLLLGSLMGLGIPEFEAKRYEAGLKNGRILISVHTDNPEEIERAQNVLEEEKAEDISSAYEKAQEDR